jgi:hypothetical protein
LVRWKILLQLANKLPKAPSTFSYFGRQRTKELAVKKELPILGVEADDIGWQHIDCKIRRELRNVFAVLLLKAVPCHEVSTRSFAKVPERKRSSILGARADISGSSVSR